MKKNSGFTLIELMIVVAIIAIIAAIAIPSLLRSRIQSNESAAIGNLKDMVGANVAYHSANYQYTGAIADLTTPADGSPPFLDGTWDPAVAKSGYLFVLADGPGGAGADFIINADPEAMNRTGVKGFFTDTTGIIRWAAGAPATVADPPISE